MNEAAGNPAPLRLAADFDAPSRQDWEREALEALNRRRPEGLELDIEQAYDRLTSHTVDGLETRPLYTSADSPGPLGHPGVAPFTRGTTVRSGEAGDGWQVAQLHEDPDAARTRSAVLTDLERGGSAVWVRVDPDAVAPEDLAHVLSDVLLDLAPVHVSSRTDQLAAAQALVAVLQASDKDPEMFTGSLGIDPIGLAAQHGTIPDMSAVAAAVELAAPFPGVRPIVVDAGMFHNAGAGDVQELAWAVASGVEYVRALTAVGLSVDEAFDGIGFRVSATTEQFITISRLRALRKLWARVGEVLGVSPHRRGAHQHAVTSLRQVSRDDAYVNVVRGTVSCFAAAAGGAETITVLPLDAAIGLPNELSRRIARNVQVVLAEESNLGRVNDPAGGSFYVESMTRQLCERAWELFGSLDGEGFAAAVADGTVAAQLAETNAARTKLLATRKLPLTGVSTFPNPDEEPLERRPRPEAPALAGITPIRDSQVFEDLRDRSTAIAAGGRPPTVLLACLGSRRDFGARESFASNLHRVAGIRSVLAEGTAPEDFARQLTEADTTVAVLCSSARMYQEQGIAVARALRGAGATEVRIAGRAEELGPDSPEGLISGDVFDGMDVVQLLSATLDALEAGQ